MSISHLVANDPEITISNIIQEVQVMFQTGCTYKHAWMLENLPSRGHGIITTNISKAINNVLKKARVLPLKALVELIFNKLVTYFHQYREEAENCVHPFPTRIFDKFLQIKLKSREHKVTTYNLYTWSDLQSGFWYGQQLAENGKHIHYLVVMFLQCIEKMGQEQILMCWRYIRDKRTEELTK
ncbi:hypothetical protein M9H77_21326 [Catharanthus roseus]|uniref:Uncharacterized protein n=1 Tax=Catharanthus roseus TaxID=4058 RepID=A0ACC0ARC4_CATRO|nr:hypothetical protein M9H77_21326 [Catharanthus roseus]